MNIKMQSEYIIAISILVNLILLYFLMPQLGPILYILVSVIGTASALVSVLIINRGSTFADTIESQNKDIEYLENKLGFLYAKFNEAYASFKRIDSSRMFESDDMVGTTFAQLRNVIELTKKEIDNVNEKQS